MSSSHLSVLKINKREYYTTVQQLCFQQSIFLREFVLGLFNCSLFYSDVCALCICMYQFNYLSKKINTEINISNICVLFLFVFKLQQTKTKKRGGGGGGGGGGGEEREV